VDRDGRWLATLEERARAVLPAPVLDYLVQGSRESVTAAEATDAWRSVRFHPHVLKDVTDVDPSVTLLGRRACVPWGVAPTTLQRTVHPEGELARARATEAAGSVMVVSSNAGTPFADIGATGVRWWLQAYLPADRTLAEPMLDRAVAAGAEAVVITVDTPVVSTRYVHGVSVWETVDPAMVRVNFDPGYDEQPGAEKALDLGPHDIGWVAGRTGLPVVVKGVLRPDDARRSVQAGASAVWVSNHGGRQLDRAAATAVCLADVRGAVEGAAEVYVDGGVRSGLDILAALALGADAVFLGRLPLLALVDGETGVAALHRELLVQTEEAMRLAGCRTVSDIRTIVPSQRPNRP
jgi:4-hydroxymandelate oxidase